MGIVTNEINANSNGGTEQLIDELNKSVDATLLENFQIIPSRFRGAEPNKILLYWAHDLPGDPECEHLKAGGYNQYERLIFVSNWQMQRFIDYYGIPWRKCIVMPNAIEAIEPKEKSKEQIRLIYHTTPHRGLNILVPVFLELAKHWKDKIHLDVYSSFKIYGWEQRDEPYKELFDVCKNHPNITYHGSVSKQEVREAVANSHIFAYPSIWAETSCRSLMEAMSGGLLCVHSNYGCLAETAASWTWMYQYHENLSDHANVFIQHLAAAIENYWKEDVQSRLASQQSYANVYYNWEVRKHQWRSLLEEILNSKKR